MVSCSKKGPDNGDDGGGGDGGGGPLYKYITFRVVCGAQQRGIVVGVRVFDEATGQKLLSTNTTNTGVFCSIVRLDTDGSYRIEFYELPNFECVRWTKNITYQDNPIWWSDGCESDPDAIVGWGKCDADYPPLDDCWGN
jgi:hypothetical protein